MAIRSKTVQQIVRYIPLADELQEALNIIQDEWKFKVISVLETKVNDSPGSSSQGFIILYDDNIRLGGAKND